jgi:hypothetical protein
LHHPESLLTPVLMLSYALLARATVRLHDRVFAKHFRAPSHELNPLWRGEVAKHGWLGWRYLAFTLLYSALVISFCEITVLPDTWVEFLLGALFSVIGLGIGRACGNPATFIYIRRHPDQLSGEVTMAYGLALARSASESAAVLVVLALLLVPALTPGTLGAVVGVSGITLRNLAWVLWRSGRNGPGTAAGGA